MKVANVSVSADSSTWGNVILSEACQRLPKIQPFIQEYRSIYSNKDGNGLGLITLQGAKAFVPVIVKEWRICPIDVIVYKQKSQSRYAYLSERSLISLLTSSSLGEPIQFKSRVGASDAYINLLSPAGGYGQRTSNPFFGAGSYSRGKNASIEEILLSSEEINLQDKANIFSSSKEKRAYARTLLEEDFKNLKEIESVRELLKSQDSLSVTKAASLLLVNDENDPSVSYLFNENEGVGIKLGESEVDKILKMDKDINSRMSKVANFHAHKMVLMGNRVNRNGNILLDYEDETIMQKDQFRPIPPKEDVYIVNNLSTYINPNLISLDGSPCSGRALCVSLKGYDVMSLVEYRALRGAPSSDLSREELIPFADKINIGSIYTILDIHSRTTTLPFIVKMKMTDEKGIASLNVVPTYGPEIPYTIKFYKGKSIKELSDATTILYPLVSSRLCSMPPNHVENLLSKEPEDKGAPIIDVEVSKGGGNLYSIKENGKFIKMELGLPILASTLIYKYGMGEAQAREFIKYLGSEKTKRFKTYISLAHNSASLDKGEDYSLHPAPTREKEAVKTSLKIASSLDKLSTFHQEDVAKAVEMDIFFNSLMSSFGKEASDPTTSSPTSSTSPTNSGPTEGNSTAPPLNSPNQGAGIMDYLLNIRPVSKDTREVIDSLTYFALGQFKKDEGLEIISKLEGDLLEVENLLCKLLLLIQMDRIPGMSYSDVKLLISDLDSFLNTILSSRVLLKNF